MVDVNFPWENNGPASTSKFVMAGRLKLSGFSPMANSTLNISPTETAEGASTSRLTPWPYPHSAVNNIGTDAHAIFSKRIIRKKFYAKLIVFAKTRSIIFNENSLMFSMFVFKTIGANFAIVRSGSRTVLLITA